MTPQTAAVIAQIHSLADEFVERANRVSELMAADRVRFALMKAKLDAQLDETAAAWRAVGEAE